MGPKFSDMSELSEEEGRGAHDYENSEKLISSFNKNNESLIRLVAVSEQQRARVEENVEIYKQILKDSNRCSTISTLKEYFILNNKGYCTNQETIYLVFQGCKCCSLKEEFNIRRASGVGFDFEEISAILKTFMSALKIYDQRFGRQIETISFEDISFQLRPQGSNQQSVRLQRFSKQESSGALKKTKIYFRDPWFREKRDRDQVDRAEINILSQLPSPERLEKSSLIMLETQQYEENKNSFNNLLSNLWTVGVLGLQLLQMNFVDDIYSKSPKVVHPESIDRYLDKWVNRLNTELSHRLSPQQLNQGFAVLNGIRILLSRVPDHRKKIYHLWGINQESPNYLNRLYINMSHHMSTSQDSQEGLSSSPDEQFISFKRQQPLNRKPFKQQYRQNSSDGFMRNQYYQNFSSGSNKISFEAKPPNEIKFVAPQYKPLRNIQHLNSHYESTGPPLNDQNLYRRVPEASHLNSLGKKKLMTTNSLHDFQILKVKQNIPSGQKISLLNSFSQGNFTQQDYQKATRDSPKIRNKSDHQPSTKNQQVSYPVGSLMPRSRQNPEVRQPEHIYRKMNEHDVGKTEKRIDDKNAQIV